MENTPCGEASRAAESYVAIATMLHFSKCSKNMRLISAARKSSRLEY
jgi:hypothetical protein